MLLTEKLRNDSRSASSLESYDSDQPVKLSDSPSLFKPATATVVIDCSSSSCSNTTNASSSCDLKMHNPVPVSRDFTTCSEKSKDCSLFNDSKSTSDMTGLDPSNNINMTTDILQTGAETLPNASSCSSTNCLQDNYNAGTRDTCETAACHVLSDSGTTQALKDSLLTIQNHVSENQVAISESSLNTDFQSCLSLNTNNASSAVEDASATIKTGLCVSINSAFDSQGIAATIMSPSEDFRSIYALKSSSLTTSPVTDEASMSESETTHSYPDSDSVDAWLEFSVTGKPAAQSLCVSRRTAWYVDKSDRLFFSSLKGPGLTWINVSQPAQQVSSSPSGFIVWRVHRGSAFSAVGRITGKSPAGTEWREVAREVAYVAVDDSVVW